MGAKNTGGSVGSGPPNISGDRANAPHDYQPVRPAASLLRGVRAVSRWFRFYSEAMRNPKVATLSDREFRLWVQLLCVAAENDGRIPPAEELKRMLNVRLDHLLTGVERLLKALLIDRLEHGYEPHNWSKFQYKSDTSTDRVAKHRQKGNVSVTAPDTDTDTEPPKPPKGGGRFRPKGAMIFLSKAEALETKNGSDGQEDGAGDYRRDAGRIPSDAVVDQRGDGGGVPARRLELLDPGS